MSKVYCVSRELLYHLFNFDPEVGVFTWKNRKGVKANSVAGAIVKGYRRISIGGKVGFPEKTSSMPRKFYNAHALAWLWQACISVKGVGHRLGYFKTPQEAHEVYMKAKQKLHPSCNFERGS
jgi:hypothetical protein